jgi:3-dehydroquinate synthase
MERVAGYGVLAHGVAVAEGMRFAAHLAESDLGTDPGWSRRQDVLLRELGLPASGCPFEPEDLLSAMRADKKVRGGVVRFVLSSAPGAWEARPVSDAVVSAALSEWCAG